VPVREQRTAIVTPVSSLHDASVPYLLDTVVVIDLGVDYRELLECLRRRQELETVTVRPTTIVYSETANRLDTWQLPPLSAELLRLCDGTRTVAEITRLFHPAGSEFDGIPSETVCVVGLTQLQDDGLIGLSALHLTRDDATARRTTSTLAPHHSPTPGASHTQQPWPAAPGQAPATSG
jgi:hypothetical protein